METARDETDVEPQDLELLSKWVKKRLFGNGNWRRRNRC
jgi:hypothetical protein